MSRIVFADECRLYCMSSKSHDHSAPYLDLLSPILKFHSSNVDGCNSLSMDSCATH